MGIPENMEKIEQEMGEKYGAQNGVPNY